MQARLPEHLRERYIRDMVDGESVYACPMCMYSDIDGFLWLNGNTQVFKLTEFATVPALMIITKTNGEYIVDVSNFKERKFSSVASGKWKAPFPVAKIIGLETHPKLTILK